MTEIIQLTETSRLRVETDESPTCPRGDWHMLTGFVKIPGRGDSRLMDVPAVHESPIDILRAWDALSNEDVIRWAKIYHGMHLDYDSEHGGFWFVRLDGSEYFAGNFPALELGTPEHLAKQAEVIEQERETYRQWAEGEVYGVILQRAVQWCRHEDGRVVDTRKEWDDVDDGAIWGNYLDDDYTAQKVALEYFDLTDDERTALS